MLLQLRRVYEKQEKVDRVFYFQFSVCIEMPNPHMLVPLCKVFSVRQQSQTHSEFPLHHTAIWQVQVFTYVGKHT